MNCVGFTTILVAVLLMVAVSAEAETQVWNFLFHDITRTEFAVGTLTSLAGGLISMRIVYHLTLISFQSQPVDSTFSAAMNAIFIGYPLGATIGATLGVISTGWALGDEGDELMAALGSAVGLGASYLIAGGLAILFCPEYGLSAWAILAVQTASTAAGATIGYNREDRCPENEMEERHDQGPPGSILGILYIES